MSERLPEPGAPRPAGPHADDEPPPEVVDFIRYCHRRRSAVWPEIYDEMCAVAARGEFNGWSHDQFAARGLTFALPEMLRLSRWVHSVLDGQTESAEPLPLQAAAP